jgi:hypothetical protein
MIEVLQMNCDTFSALSATPDQFNFVKTCFNFTLILRNHLFHGNCIFSCDQCLNWCELTYFIQTAKQQSLCAKYFKSLDFYVKQNNILQNSAKSNNISLLNLCIRLNNQHFLKVLVC